MILGDDQRVGTAFWTENVTRGGVFLLPLFCFVDSAQVPDGPPFTRRTADRGTCDCRGLGAGLPGWRAAVVGAACQHAGHDPVDDVVQFRVRAFFLLLLLVVLSTM